MLLSLYSVSAIVGPHFPVEIMKRLRDVYAEREGTHRRYRNWRQVLPIQSKNTVQILNFGKRVRNEKRQGLRLQYLLLVDYSVTNRYLDELIDNARDLRLTFILYGAGCIEGIPEEMRTRVNYYCELLTKDLYDGAPIIACRGLQAQEEGVLDVPTNTQNEKGQQQAEAYFMRQSDATWNVMQDFQRWRSNDNVQFSHRRSTTSKEYYGSGSAKTPSTYAPAGASRACALLGITRDQAFNQDVVRKAYRKLALRYHPDKVQARGGDTKKCAEEFHQIKEAFNLLAEKAC